MLLSRKEVASLLQCIAKQPPIKFVLTGSHLLPLLGKEVH